MGHKVTITDCDGDTQTLARYPNHADAAAHLHSYAIWSSEDWDVAEDYRTAESEDGARLAVSPTPVYTVYEPGNVATDPRSGVLNWDSTTITLDGLKLIGCEDSDPDALVGKIAPDTLGVAIDGLTEYLDAHKTREVGVPEYYSEFPDDSMELHLNNSRGMLNIGLVEAGIRVLNGSGRYPASEHVLHDCLPMPCILEREGTGAVVLAPRKQKESDDGD